jgi:hypothetical protein
VHKVKARSTGCPVIPRGSTLRLNNEGINPSRCSVHVCTVSADRIAWRMDEYAYLSAYCESVRPNAALC